MTIIQCEPTDKTWDRFVEVHPQATVAHLMGWRRVVEAAYGHRTFYLAAVDSGEVVGVLPLVEVASRLFGRRLVSMPFMDYGGILATRDSGAERALLDAALALGRERRGLSVGLRQFHPIDLGETPAEGRATMLLTLESEQAVWKALPSERRNRVRKGQKNGLTATWIGAEGLSDFYAVFAENMRDLGSPVHSRRFFRLMLEELPDVARVLLVRTSAGQTVGAAVCLFFRGTIMVPWVSSLRSAFALCPNFVLYWEVISHGCREGYRVLDLGRSFKNAGTFEFKRQWGAVPHDLPWLFVDVVPGAPTSVDRDASRFSPLIEVWKRLPLPVANLLGPWVRKRVPN